MTQWVRAASLPASVDLAGLSGFLRQRGIVHRITEEQDQQVIWVDRVELIDPLAQLIDQLQSGELNIDTTASDNVNPGNGRLPKWQKLRHIFLSRPMTTLMLGLSLLGAGVVSWDEQLGLKHWLTFQDYIFIDGSVGLVSVNYSLAQGQVWRLLTPIFLHFGLFHILFNSLWLWEFGRRIEVLIGPWLLFNLIVIIAVLSNVSQYLWQNSLPFAGMFGGMSGVIYGLLGYIWQRQRLSPRAELSIPPGIIGFMLFWLIFCMTGILDWIAQIKIANAAHLSGLVVGMSLGILAGWRDRRSKD